MPNVAAAVSRSNATATTGSTTVRSSAMSSSGTTTETPTTTGQIREAVSLRKSPSEPAGPPTATCVPVACANASTRSWRSSPSRWLRGSSEA